MALTYTNRVRIVKEVSLRAKPAHKDSKEEAAYRAKIEAEKKKADAEGLAFDLPNEWEGGFD